MRLVDVTARGMSRIRPSLSFDACSSDSLSRVASLNGPQLLFWGEKDKHITPEERATVTNALKQAGKSYVNVEFADADHGTLRFDATFDASYLLCLQHFYD